MPPIPTVIGGHTVRDPPQLDPGVSLNMYPERSKRETEFQSRQARFQLATHGFDRFTRDANLPPVTGMAGSRERIERLVVANGRYLRVFADPENPARLTELTVSGYPEPTGTEGEKQTLVRLRPVLGCVHLPDHSVRRAGDPPGTLTSVDNPWYWVRDDGQVWWNTRTAGAQPRRVVTSPLDHWEGLTPLGMTCQPNSDTSDVERLFITCVEDRRIRCWRHSGTPGTFERDEANDLPLGEETAINSPESLWLTPNTPDPTQTNADIARDGNRFVVPGGNRRLVIMDATTGRVVEYEYQPDAGDDTWTQQTPVGLSNPFSFQRTSGDKDTLEPIPFGGIYGDQTEVRVANRETRTQIISNRRTGEALSTDTLPEVTDGEPTQKAVCGVVGGSHARLWYVNGAQYRAEPDGSRLGRIFSGREGATVKETTPPLPDAEQADPGPTLLVPMGDEGRHMGWVVDRRLHVLDLENDRLITNVEGSVDSLTYSTGRLIGADASIGEIKVSPINQIQTVDTETYGETVAAASLRIPGYPADRPRTTNGMVIGIRDILIQIDAEQSNRAGDIVALKRNALHETLPERLNDMSTQVAGVCLSGRLTAVLLADSSVARTLTVRRYTVPPATTDEYGGVIMSGATLPATPTNRQRFQLTADQTVGGIDYKAGVLVWDESDIDPAKHRWFNDRLLNSPGSISAVNLPSGGVGAVTAYAASPSRLFVVWSDSVTNPRRVRTFDIESGAEEASLTLGDITATRKQTDTGLSPDTNVPDVAMTVNAPQRAKNMLFDGLEFARNPGARTVAEGDRLPQDWIRGITFIYDPDETPGEGFLLVAVKQKAGEPTVIRAFTHDGTDWRRAQARDLTTETTTENRMLAHDAQFVFDSNGEFINDQTPDGDPIRSIAVVAHRHAFTQRLSQYAWNPEQRSITGANAVAAIRRNLYAWTATGMELRDLTDETEGFPYALEEARTVGLVAPNSVAVVADVLYWLGVTEGGGLRVWRVGFSGDTVTEFVEGKAIEEMFDRVAKDAVGALSEAVGWADDTGGHPTYVLHIPRAGISVAYDADADRWHVRSSKRAAGDAPLTWPWLPATEGVQRVAHSTNWRQRLVCGGYDVMNHGAVGFYSPTDWRDVDQGEVLRRRQFAAGEAERRRVRFARLRVDATYNQQPPAMMPRLPDMLPRFTLEMSNDGGETWTQVGTRSVGPFGSGAPRPFYRMGYSRQRVYRVDFSANVPFALMGAYQEAAP